MKLDLVCMRKEQDRGGFVKKGNDWPELYDTCIYMNT